MPAPAKEPTARSPTLGFCRGNSHLRLRRHPCGIKSTTACQALTIDIVSASGGTVHLGPGVS